MKKAQEKLACSDARLCGVIRELEIEGEKSGSLRGLSFVAKDLFDVQGYVTGAGNPDWLRTHSIAQSTAPAIKMCLSAGAKLIGKSCTDELAFSMEGRNVHYGTPLNPQAPDRIPGGSSSGSASAVAGRLVDFALGTDTGGSVRIPASYCGIYGFRPTHGRIPLDGVVPLAPSFDTVGWFGRDAQLLRLLGTVLLKEQSSPGRPSRLLIADDAFSAACERTRKPLEDALKSALGSFGALHVTILSHFTLDQAFEHFRILQGFEAWQAHGAWIESVHPGFDASIQSRFEFAKTVTQEQYSDSLQFRLQLVQVLDALLEDQAVICLPATFDLAPELSADRESMLANRIQTMKLTCIASLCGLPQITIPVRFDDRIAVGLSFIADRNNDMLLLDLGDRLVDLLRYT